MNRELKFRAWDEDDENYIYWGVGEEIPYRNDMELPYVKSVVEQYTGLKDKQGVKIFEGDIVKIHLGLNIWQTKEVYFDNDLCEFGFKETHENLYSMYSKHYEVIGNIHEEPKA